MIFNLRNDFDVLSLLSQFLSDNTHAIGIANKTRKHHVQLSKKQKRESNLFPLFRAKNQLHHFSPRIVNLAHPFPKQPEDPPVRLEGSPLYDYLTNHHFLLRREDNPFLEKQNKCIIVFSLDPFTHPLLSPIKKSTHRQYKLDFSL